MKRSIWPVAWTIVEKCLLTASSTSSYSVHLSVCIRPRCKIYFFLRKSALKYFMWIERPCFFPTTIDSSFANTSRNEQAVETTILLPSVVCSHVCGPNSTTSWWGKTCCASWSYYDRETGNIKCSTSSETHKHAQTQTNGMTTWVNFKLPTWMMDAVNSACNHRSLSASFGKMCTFA